ncbi:gluconokinase [Aeromicrobium sp. A1-2]|uniref:gluconokinase n=1 Tax=Aeromicrobium sp. A1-2 TaxID=2107713 RepID=UPI0020B13B04|nr:gluconokinase [Aeromicrobium sp. A1-2]
MSAARQIVVMGVSGTGKSVIGQALAESLGLTFIEGDAFHPTANIAKMSAGTPLDDDDRRPWLTVLAGKLDANRQAGIGSVLACSALKRDYRDILRHEAPDAFFLHLDLPFDVLRDRMEKREHFMPTSLLQSQFDTLERLGADERGHVLDFDAPLPEVIAAATAAAAAA